MREPPAAMAGMTPARTGKGVLAAFIEVDHWDDPRAYGEGEPLAVHL